MLRHTRLARLLATTAVVGLAGIVGLGGTTTGSPAAAVTGDPSLGSTQGPSGYLYRGCHLYTYSYDYHPPSGPGPWAAEVFITAPNGGAAASGAQLEGSDPLTGQATFKLCVPTSQPGTYAIDVKLSRGQDGDAQQFIGYLPTSTFTLTKQPRHRHPRPVNALGPVRVL